MPSNEDTYKVFDINLRQHYYSKAFLTDYDLSALILTCGTEGSHVFTINEESYMETPKVDVVDTVGAGDSFTAAFIASLIKGKSMKEAHESAMPLY
jgi:fructokinase